MSTFENCGTGNVKSVRSSDCAPTLFTRKVAFSKIDFSFANADAAKAKANWDTAIANGDIYVFTEIQNVESQNVEPVFEQLLTKTIQVQPSIKQTQFQYVESDCVHSAIRTFNNTSWLMYEFSEGDLFKAIEETDGTIKGQKVQVFVDIQTTAIGAESGKTNVVVRYNDPFEYEKKGSVLKLDTVFGDLEGAATVSIEEVGTSLATQINLDAKLACGGDDVTTLVLADFLVKDGAGVTVVPSSVTYNATSGLYEIVGTGFANGYTVEIVPKITPEIIYTGGNIVTVANI